MFNLETITRAAVDTHVWADTFAEDENGELVTADEIMYLDSDMVHHDSHGAIADDVEEFVNAARELLELARERHGLTDEQIGHDFALTRGGHGAGFWDRGMRELGEGLSRRARVFGSVSGYVEGVTVYFE